jgi:hypothetical protein
LSSGQVITAKTGAIGPNNFTDTTATITATDVGIYGNQLNGFIFGDAIVTASPTGSTNQTSSIAEKTIPTATATGSAASSSSSSASSAPERSPSILSTTAGKVAVYVGVPVAVIVLCSFIGMILLYRRRAARSKFVELEAKAPVFEVRRPPPRPPHPPQELWSPVESKEKKFFEVETNEKPVEMWAGRNSR